MSSVRESDNGIKKLISNQLSKYIESVNSFDDFDANNLENYILNDPMNPYLKKINGYYMMLSFHEKVSVQRYVQIIIELYTDLRHPQLALNLNRKIMLDEIKDPTQQD